MPSASRLLAALCIVVTACRLDHAESGRPPGPPTVVDSLARIEQDSTLEADVLASLRVFYNRLGARDWRAVRGAFGAGGTVTSRLVPSGERAPRALVQSADEYVKRESDAAGRVPFFSARMLHVHVTGYGELAEAWVIAERRAGKSRDSAQVTRDIDAFHLYRERGAWRITALSSAGEQPRRPLAVPSRRR